MGRVWAVYVNDVKHLFKNIVAAIIVVGLIILPSIFAWYNIMSCWNVFENTSNLKVAVANSDEGYESDLFPMKIDVGDTVIGELHQNSQINWVFVNEEEALEGVQSGKYYAAVVLPASFSRDIFTFYSEDIPHSDIIYYSNEKINAISPRITSTGASTISYTVNEVFAETISQVALSVAKTLDSYVDDSEVGGQISSLSDQIRTVGTHVGQAADVLTMYADLADASGEIVQQSSSLVSDTTDNAQTALSSVNDVSASMGTTVGTLQSASRSFSSALGKTADGLQDLIDDLDNGLGGSTLGTKVVGQQLRTQASTLDSEIASYQKVLEALSIDSETNAGAIRQTQKAILSLSALRDGLNDTADSLETSGFGGVIIDKIRELAEQAKSDVLELKTEFDTNTIPVLDDLAQDTADLCSTMSDVSGSLSSLNQSLNDDLGQAGSDLSDVASTLRGMSTRMASSASELTALADGIDEALVSGDTSELKGLLSSDTGVAASALAQPVQLERNAVFVQGNFGSGMAPLYSTIALFVGALITMVLLKPRVQGRCLEELPCREECKPRHFFFGRALTVLTIAFLQSSLMALGNMFFLGVQIDNPLLYLIAFWATSFLFMTMAYTMVLLFANLGKGVLVLLLIIQVTGSGGSYPLQLLPDFVQNIAPFLPAYHVVNAMRAAMMGVYMNDFAIEILVILAMSIPFWLAAIFLRKPIMRFMDWYVARAEKSKMFE